MRNGSTLPLYKILIDDLKKLIDQGTYKKGELLPSENELCKKYNTTRPTVRQALSELINAGYITRQQGKGSIVTEPKQGLGVLSVSSVSDAELSAKLITEIIEKPQKRKWADDFFYELTPQELDSGCIYFSRRKHISDLPVMFEETFITNVGLPHFTNRNLENRSLLKTLKDHYQIEVKEGEQKIWAVEADPKISELLNVDTGVPVVHMKRKLKTNRSDVNIYTLLYCNTDEYYLEEAF